MSETSDDQPDDINEDEEIKETDQSEETTGEVSIDNLNGDESSEVDSQSVDSSTASEAAAEGATESSDRGATSEEGGSAGDESEGSDESQTETSEPEATSEEGDSTGDETEEAETSADTEDPPENQEASGLSLIEEHLRSVNTKIDKLANPTDRQLNKAKGLILMLSGITGIVMIASITFFIVMAMSISQKVNELDRVLMAVAKRGIQLGDGIETIAEMENKLVEVIEQNSPIPSSLANIETQLITHGRTLIEKEAETRSVVQDQAESIITSQNGIKNELGAEFDGLERLVNKLGNLNPLIKEHSELKKQLESLNQAVLNVETKVHDLYVIKQAEMENAYRELTSGG